MDADTPPLPHAPRQPRDRGRVQAPATATVTGTWRNLDGTLKRGTYHARLTCRVTTDDGTIYPASVVAGGHLATTGPTSLAFDCPRTDAPELAPAGWRLNVEVRLENGPTETYTDLPVTADTVDLADVVFPGDLPEPRQVLIVGVPSGVAGLDADGDVVDADGTKIIGGGDGGPVGWDDVQDRPTVFPPAPHVHVLDDVDGLTDALDVLAEPVTWTQVADRPPTFPPTAHRHPWTAIDDVPSTFAPAAHGHTITDVDGLADALDAAAPLTNVWTRGQADARYATAAAGTAALSAVQPAVMAQAITDATTALKNTILGGAGPTFDTLTELRDLMVAGDDADQAAIVALTEALALRLRVDVDQALTAPQKAAARTNLGLGTAATAAAGDFQPVDPDLVAIAALTTTSFGRDFLTLANAAAVRSKLDLGSAATAAVGDFQGASAELATLAAQTSTVFGRARMRDADAETARGALGLGSAATQSVAAFQPADPDLVAIAALSTTAWGRALLEVADAAALRTAAGLGTAATSAATDFVTAAAATARANVRVAHQRVPLNAWIVQQAASVSTQSMPNGLMTLGLLWLPGGTYDAVTFNVNVAGSTGALSKVVAYAEPNDGLALTLPVIEAAGVDVTSTGAKTVTGLSWVVPDGGALYRIGAITQGGPSTVPQLAAVNANAVPWVTTGTPDVGNLGQPSLLVTGVTGAAPTNPTPSLSGNRAARFAVRRSA